MRDKDFDDIFKSKLEGKKVEFDPEHWSKMEASLDQLDASEGDVNELFDQKIREKLDSNHANYQESHWSLLEQRLNLSSALKTRIFVSKVTEISIILLLVFTFFNLDLDHKYNRQERANIISPEAIASISQRSANQKLATLPSQILRSNKISTQSARLDYSHVTTEQYASQPIRSSKEVYTNPLIEEIVSKTKAKSSFSSITEGDPSKNITRLTSLASLDLKDLENTQDIVSIQSTMLPSITPVKPNKQKGKWYFNAYGSVDINYILSPLDKTFFTPSYTIDALGSTAGLGISYRKGIAELGLGANYSTKSYKPRHTQETVGSFLDGYEINSLDHILFNIVSTPVTLRLHHINKEKWSLYSCLGIAPNLIINAHYIRTEEFIPGAAAAESRSFVSKFEEKSFDDGILHGGSINDNLYLSSTVGMGVQYNPIDQLSLYLQPSYSLHVLSPGVGPNDDKLYNFSLELGAKYQLF